MSEAHAYKFYRLRHVLISLLLLIDHDSAQCYKAHKIEIRVCTKLENESLKLCGAKSKRTNS